MAKSQVNHRQSPVDIAAAAIVLAFACLVSLFAIRNNDIWWLLAVARRIVETQSFITQDPFTFTVEGAPWAPQSYLAALVFYAVHGLTSAWGLIIVRAVLVVAIFAVSLWTLSRVGVGWALASPVVLVALLNAQSRFLVRAHLFEYLFLVILVWFLLTAARRQGKSFFVIPIVLQLLWVNTHPSFAIAPALALLFFGGEWLSGVLAKRSSLVRPHATETYNWRRVGVLLVLMLVACLVNPSPGLFLTQPFGGEQRELISRFTLEWRSPFDPALKHGAFHPYYEILLGLATLAIVLSLHRLKLAPALLVVATAYLSFQAHRFRVEFALVSLPMIFILLASSTVVQSIRRRLTAARYGALAARLLAIAASVVLIATAADRVSIGGAVADRYPVQAFDYVRTENIANRAYHKIGHGSFLLWELYGERKSFIDGRNFNPSLYRDFLLCQTSYEGRRRIAGKYDLDAFIIPPLERSDAGMERVHRSLVQDDRWTLCYLDRHSWIYVRRDAVDSQWLAQNGHRAYHPMTLHNRKMREEEMLTALTDLERAVNVSPAYARIRVDLALVYMAVGDIKKASREVDQILEIDPNHKAALDIRERLRDLDR